MFNKWSIRIVTVLTGVVVLGLTLAHFTYPAMINQLTAIQAIVTTVYLGYMGWHVGFDWGRESLQSK